MTLWDVLKHDTNQVAYRVEEFRLRRLIERGKLSPDDMVRLSTETEWRRIGDLPETAWQDSMPDARERKRLREQVPLPPTEPEVPSRPAKAPKPAPPIERPAKPSAVPTDPQETVPVEMEGGKWKGPSAISLAIGPLANSSPGDSSAGGSARRSRVQAPPLRKARPVEHDASRPIAAKRRHDEDLDLTAMADVTFLLIFFFMVTLAYSPQKSIDTPPPSSQEQSAQQAPTLDDLRDDNVIVEVLPDDTILLNDRTVPASELDELLARAMSETGLNEVIIRAAGAARHETVVRAYDAANEAGAQRIRLATVEADDAASG